MASFFLSLEKKTRPQSRLQTSYIIDLFSPSLVTITNICHATSAVLAYFILSRLRPQPTATSELSPFQLLATIIRSKTEKADAAATM